MCDMQEFLQLLKNKLSHCQFLISEWRRAAIYKHESATHADMRVRFWVLQTNRYRAKETEKDCCRVQMDDVKLMFD